MDDLLIATSNGVYKWRKEQKYPDCIHHGWGVYYGISWDEKWVYLAAHCSHRIPKLEGRENIFVLDSDLNWIGEFQIHQNLVDLHQIHFSGGKLHVCNTGKNRIETIERNDGKKTNHLGLDESKIFKIEIHNYTGIEENIHHINSIWSDDNLIYAVEHRKGPSRVKVFDRDFSLLREEKIGVKAHNVYVENNEMVVCSSEGEQVLIRNLSTGEDRAIDTNQYAQGITRGLARIQGRWYVGVSQREIRERRHEALDGTILVFDDGFNLRRKITLPKVGQVLEIRATAEIDFAHNRIPFPGRILLG